jgi:CubicO group peptidase (beta-lactamase class C family)
MKRYLQIIALIFLLPSCALLDPYRSVTYDQPGSPWQSQLDPEAVGYSLEKLAEVGAYVETLSTDAIVVITGGRVLWEYGDTTQLSYVASVRKSILAILYGNYVANGTIDLDLTLADLGMNDVQGLLPIEQLASVKDLIAARSGVYHPASNPGGNLAEAPARGSQEPGSYYLYSNWDFNAAGAVFEQLTGKNIYDALSTDLARPLGFEHWNRSIHRKNGDTSRSVNKAYHMVLSTRDMAKLGELMLQEGSWQGVQLVPKDWVKTIISVTTPSEEMNPEYLSYGEFGFGYMWWVWDGDRVDCLFEGGYTARGAYGQYITVIPKLDMVVAHKTVPRDRTSWKEYKGILTRLAASRKVPICS